MAQYDLLIDLQSGEPVIAVDNPAAAPLPPFVQGDTLNLRIFLLNRTSTYPVSTPYTLLNVAGIGALQVALGDKIGNATNYYTTQFTWTADTVNNCFTAALPMNTAAITTLIGANPSASTWLEVKYLVAGLPTTVLEKQITIQAAVIKAGGLPPLPPGLTPLSAEYANATFLPRQVQGAITLVSPDGTKKLALYIDNDGTFHTDPIS